MDSRFVNIYLVPMIGVFGILLVGMVTMLSGFNIDSFIYSNFYTEFLFNFPFSIALWSIISVDIYVREVEKKLNLSFDETEKEEWIMAKSEQIRDESGNLFSFLLILLAAPILLIGVYGTYTYVSLKIGFTIAYLIVIMIYIVRKKFMRSFLKFLKTQD